MGKELKKLQDVINEKDKEIEKAKQENVKLMQIMMEQSGALSKIIEKLKIN